MFNRLDILAAYWLFLSGYHEGQGSVSYMRLCSILDKFSPSPLWREPRHLPWNARQIYKDLVVKYHGKHSTAPREGLA